MMPHNMSLNSTLIRHAVIHNLTPGPDDKIRRVVIELNENLGSSFCLLVDNELNENFAKYLRPLLRLSCA